MATTWGNANIIVQKELLVRLELLLELLHGDQNTSFFQNHATKRQRKKTIKGLLDENGVMQEDRGRIHSNGAGVF